MSGSRATVLPLVRRVFTEYAGLSDRELVGRFVNDRDHEAFRSIVDRHGPMVWRACRGLLTSEQDAEDVYQATFLVLARKAASLGDREAVGSWLYGTSRRIAMKARTTTIRRRRRESEAPGRPPRDPLAEITLREAQAILDEELERLPESYRAPVVLCCLEDHSREDAARLLGWTVATVKNRLEQARKFLRLRLNARGLTISPALFAALLSPAHGWTVPPAVQQTLLDGIRRSGSGLSHGAIILAEGMMKNLTVRVKIGVTLALIVGIAAGGMGTLIAPRAAEEPPPPSRQPGPLPPAPPLPQVDAQGDPLPDGAMMRLGTLRLKHGGWSACLSFPPDGKSIVSTNEDNRIRFWDAGTGKLKQLLKVEGERRTLTHAFSPDGKLLASGGYDGLQLRDAATGTVVRKIDAGSVGLVAFSHDGKHLATTGYEIEYSIRIFDLASGKETLRLLWHANRVGALAFTPDGKAIVSASAGEGKCIISDLQTGQEVSTFLFPVRRAHLDTVALSPDGKVVAFGGAESARQGEKKVDRPLLRLYETSSGKEIQDLTGHKKWVLSSRFSPDGKKLVSCGYDGRMIVWDVGTGKELTRMERANGRTDGVFTFSPDGKTLASTSSDHTIHVWDLATGKERFAPVGHQGGVEQVAYSPDGTYLATGSMDDRTAQIWDARTGKRLHVLTHPDYLRSLAFLPDGHTIVTGAGDSFIRLWDIRTGKERRRFTVEGRQQVLSMRLTADGKLLFAITTGFEQEGNVLLSGWEVETGKVLLSATIAGGFFSDFPAIAPDGRSFVLPQGTGAVIRATKGDAELVKLNPPPDYCIQSPIVHSPDGKLIAVRTSRPRQEGPRSFHDDYSVRIYETATGKELHAFNNDSWHTTLAFSPDGKRLAFGGEQFIRIFDVQTGKKRHHFTTQSPAHSLAYSPDGDKLAAGFSDTTVVIWKLDD